MDDNNNDGGTPSQADETTPVEVPPEKPPVEEFPEKLYCHQCRRLFAVKNLRAKANTLLTEAALVCPRCRRKLRRMKLKDWYDHYVQGQPQEFTLDVHGFTHVDPAGFEVPADRPPPPRPQDSRNRNRRRRRGSERRNSRDQRDRPDDSRKKSILPRDIKAYRLPKRRRTKQR